MSSRFLQRRSLSYSNILQAKPIIAKITTPILIPIILAPLAPGVLSSCPPGTRLTNLNHIKNGADPIALPDLEYPAWLWTLTSTTPTAASSSSSTANKKTSASGSGSSTTTTKSEKKEKVEMKRTNKVAIKARNSLKG